MRILLLSLSAVSALVAIVLLADMKDGGTYIEVVALGVFFGASVVALGCAGIIGKLDQIRERNN
jgi:hypothetical protein